MTFLMLSRFFVENPRFKLTFKLVLVCWGSDQDLIHIVIVVGEETGFCSSRHYIYQFFEEATSIVVNCDG